MSKNFHETWRDIVGKIARFVSYDFPDVDPEDLQQDLYVLILEREWDNPDEPSVVLVMRKVAREHALRYRSEHLMLSPQYNYRTSDVRRILERVFCHEDWVPQRGFDSVDEEGTAVPENRPAEPSYDLDDSLASYSDVKRAWGHLPENARRIIFERYALGVELDKNGDKRLRRAIEKLTDILNTYQPIHHHQGPGSRRALSNAQARYRIDNPYEN